MFFRNNGRVLMVFAWDLVTDGLSTHQCRDGNMCYGKMRLAQFNADTGAFDFYVEQEDAFGESAAVVAGDWNENNYGAIFIGGASDDDRWPY